MKEAWSKEGAECPYCGQINEDSGDCELYSEESQEIECYKCGKKFNVVGYMSWSWTSQGKEDA